MERKRVVLSQIRQDKILYVFFKHFKYTKLMFPLYRI